jgi:hypothetical protein
VVHFAGTGLTPKQLSIVLPATDGLIVFYADDPIVHYLPWNQVSSLDAAETPRSGND